MPPFSMMPRESSRHSGLLGTMPRSRQISAMMAPTGRRPRAARWGWRVPLVPVEVLSPDSGTKDRATKLRAYFKLPSVQHYLIVWPEERRIVRHSRMPNDQVATRIFVSGEIGLDPPGLTVTVEEFYVD